MLLFSETVGSSKEEMIPLAWKFLAPGAPWFGARARMIDGFTQAANRKMDLHRVRAAMMLNEWRREHASLLAFEEKQIERMLAVDAKVSQAAGDVKDPKFLMMDGMIRENSVLSSRYRSAGNQAIDVGGVQQLVLDNPTEIVRAAQELRNILSAAQTHLFDKELTFKTIDFVEALAAGGDRMIWKVMESKGAAVDGFFLWSWRKSPRCSQGRLLSVRLSQKSSQLD